jgi:hypothetical protein
MVIAVVRRPLACVGKSSYAACERDGRGERNEKREEGEEVAAVKRDPVRVSIVLAGADECGELAARQQHEYFRQQQGARDAVQSRPRLHR